jgi:hypothetical protein
VNNILLELMGTFQSKLKRQNMYIVIFQTCLMRMTCYVYFDFCALYKYTFLSIHREIELIKNMYFLVSFLRNVRLTYLFKNNFNSLLFIVANCYFLEKYFLFCQYCGR